MNRLIKFILGFAFLPVLFGVLYLAFEHPDHFLVLSILAVSIGGGVYAMESE